MISVLVTVDDDRGAACSPGSMVLPTPARLPAVRHHLRVDGADPPGRVGRVRRGGAGRRPRGRRHHHVRPAAGVRHRRPGHPPDRADHGVAGASESDVRGTAVPHEGRRQRGPRPLEDGARRRRSRAGSPTTSRTSATSTWPCSCAGCSSWSSWSRRSRSSPTSWSRMWRVSGDAVKEEQTRAAASATRPAKDERADMRRPRPGARAGASPCCVRRHRDRGGRVHHPPVEPRRRSVRRRLQAAEHHRARRPVEVERRRRVRQPDPARPAAAQHRHERVDLADRHDALLVHRRQRRQPAGRGCYYAAFGCTNLEPQHRGPRHRARRAPTTTSRSASGAARLGAGESAALNELAIHNQAGGTLRPATTTTASSTEQLHRQPEGDGVHPAASWCGGPSPSRSRWSRRSRSSYANGDHNPHNNAIRPHLKVVDTGTVPDRPARGDAPLLVHP